MENLRGIFIKNIPFPGIPLELQSVSENIVRSNIIRSKNFSKSRKNKVRGARRANNEGRGIDTPILISVEIRFGIYSSDDESKGSTTRNSPPYCHPVANTPSKVCPLYYWISRGCTRAWVTRGGKERLLVSERTLSNCYFLPSCAPAFRYTPTRTPVYAYVSTRARFSRLPSFVRSF